MINNFYTKNERKYVGNFDKNNIVHVCSPIFEISKSHFLKT